MYNNICWGNSNDNDICIYGSGTANGYTNDFSTTSGFSWTSENGNMDADPLFKNSESGDYHLTVDSPCMNMGTNAAPGLPTRDFEKDPRIMRGIVDIGADEFGKPMIPFIPLLLED